MEVLYTDHRIESSKEKMSLSFDLLRKVILCGGMVSSSPLSHVLLVRNRNINARQVTATKMTTDAREDNTDETKTME